jgi:hypothetical protein
MKRILFFCCIALMPCTATMAQSANTVSPAVSEKAMFSSRINEMDANLSRKNDTRAKTLFEDLKKDMTKHMNDRKMALRDVPEADRPAARAKYDTEQRLFLEVLDLSKDLSANRAEIHTKLTQYYVNF